MAVIQGNAHKSSVTGFYPNPIDQSLRFNDNDSAYLSRTPASAGNQKTWTISFWIKRANIDALQWIYQADSDTWARFDANGQLTFNNRNGGTNYFLTFAPQFRDVSAWYHFVIACDTTQATDSNRFKLYVNGEQITELDTFTTYPPQNHDTEMNEASLHRFFGSSTGSNYFDGYCAEFHFTDGTAYDADAFGEFKEGVWVAKAPSVTYGTNGFYLDFADGAAIGDDESGNGNDWTANNLAATDVVLDSPTNNFAVLNKLTSEASSKTLSEGNLAYDVATADTICSTMPIASGKYYYETVLDSGNCTFGLVVNPEIRLANTGSNTIFRIFASDAAGPDTPSSSVVTDNLSAMSAGDVIGVAVDADALTVDVYRNNSLVFAADSFTVDGPYFPAFDRASSSGTSGVVHIVNFGQDSSFAGNKTAQGNTDANGRGDFYYTPPTDYLALSTANLPDLAIDPAQGDSPEDYFNTVLYTGNLTAGHQITGVGFQPDFVWIKNRTDPQDHVLTDAVRGATIRLESNTTDAETTQTKDLQSFNTDGFTVGAQTRVNGSGDSLVAWNWKANGSGVSNTDGSITSTVSANTESGFSIVSYTGNGTIGATIGHGLGVVPDMIITKNRTSGSSHWAVYWHEFGGTQRLLLSSTAAVSTDNAYWNNTDATSSVFTVHQNIANNESSSDFIAYCFHSVEGFSKFGSYTGNGSADGPFVYTGFRPAFVLVKRTSGSSSWVLKDAARDTYNTARYKLKPDVSNAEADAPSDGTDFLSNGFKARGTSNELNGSGETYIYMAFSDANGPFKYSNAR